MYYDYYQFQAVGTPTEGEDRIATILVAGELTLLCQYFFDSDPVSDTYNKWICTLEDVSEDEDKAQRSLVMNPGTLHFEGDTEYIVSIASELSTIGLYDLEKTYITIGVPKYE